MWRRPLLRHNGQRDKRHLRRARKAAGLARERAAAGNLPKLSIVRLDPFVRALRRIGDYFDFQVNDLNQDQLLDYFHALLQRLSWSAVKLDLYGLKFFYIHVPEKPWTDVLLIKPPRTKRIPDVISVDEVRNLIMSTNRLSYRVTGHSRPLLIPGRQV